MYCLNQSKSLGQYQRPASAAAASSMGASRSTPAGAPTPSRDPPPSDTAPVVQGPGLRQTTPPRGDSINGTLPAPPTADFSSAFSPRRPATAAASRAVAASHCYTLGHKGAQRHVHTQPPAEVGPTHSPTLSPDGTVSSLTASARRPMSAAVAAAVVRSHTHFHGRCGSARPPQTQPNGGGEHPAGGAGVYGGRPHAPPLLFAPPEGSAPPHTLLSPRLCLAALINGATLRPVAEPSTSRDTSISPGGAAHRNSLEEHSPAPSPPPNASCSKAPQPPRRRPAARMAPLQPAELQEPADENTHKPVPNTTPPTTTARSSTSSGNGGSDVADAVPVVRSILSERFRGSLVKSPNPSSSACLRSSLDTNEGSLLSNTFGAPPNKASKRVRIEAAPTRQELLRMDAVQRTVLLCGPETSQTATAAGDILTIDDDGIVAAAPTSTTDMEVKAPPTPPPPPKATPSEKMVHTLEQQPRPSAPRRQSVPAPGSSRADPPMPFTDAFGQSKLASITALPDPQPTTGADTSASTAAAAPETSPPQSTHAAASDDANASTSTMNASMSAVERSFFKVVNDAQRLSQRQVSRTKLDGNGSTTTAPRAPLFNGGEAITDHEELLGAAHHPSYGLRVAEFTYNRNVSGKTAVNAAMPLSHAAMQGMSIVRKESLVPHTSAATAASQLFHVLPTSPSCNDHNVPSLSFFSSETNPNTNAALRTIDDINGLSGVGASGLYGPAAAPVAPTLSSSCNVAGADVFAMAAGLAVVGDGDISEGKAPPRLRTVLGLAGGSGHPCASATREAFVQLHHGPTIATDDVSRPLQFRYICDTDPTQAGVLCRTAETTPFPAVVFFPGRERERDGPQPSSPLSPRTQRPPPPQPPSASLGGLLLCHPKLARLLTTGVDVADSAPDLNLCEETVPARTHFPLAPQNRGDNADGHRAAGAGVVGAAACEATTGTLVIPFSAVTACRMVAIPSTTVAAIGLGGANDRGPLPSACFEQVPSLACVHRPRVDRVVKARSAGKGTQSSPSDGTSAANVNLCEFESINFVSVTDHNALTQANTAKNAAVDSDDELLLGGLTAIGLLERPGGARPHPLQTAEAATAPLPISTAANIDRVIRDTSAGLAEAYASAAGGPVTNNGSNSSAPVHVLEITYTLPAHVVIDARAAMPSPQPSEPAGGGRNNKLGVGRRTADSFTVGSNSDLVSLEMDPSRTHRPLSETHTPPSGLHSERSHGTSDRSADAPAPMILGLGHRHSVSPPASLPAIAAAPTEDDSAPSAATTIALSGVRLAYDAQRPAPTDAGAHVVTVRILTHRCAELHTAVTEALLESARRGAAAATAMSAIVGEEKAMVRARHDEGPPLSVPHGATPSEGSGSRLSDAAHLSDSGNPPRVKTITIVHFNDVYNLDPRGEPDTRGVIGGAARFHTILERLREYDNPLVVFSGDFMGPSLMSVEMKGRQIIDCLNLIGVHYATFGNHEFDYGKRALQDAVHGYAHGPHVYAGSNARWVMSNMFEGPNANKRSTMSASWASDSKISAGGGGGPAADGAGSESSAAAEDVPICGASHRELFIWNGVTVGLIGISENWLPSCSQLTSGDYLYRDMFDVAEATAQQLRVDGAELVLCLSHSRVANDKELMRRCPSIDLLLGGHDHFYKCVPSLRIVKSGEEFQFLTEIRVEIASQGLANHALSSVVDRYRLGSSANDPPGSLSESASTDGASLSGVSPSTSQSFTPRQSLGLNVGLTAASGVFQPVQRPATPPSARGRMITESHEGLDPFSLLRGQYRQQVVNMKIMCHPITVELPQSPPMMKLITKYQQKLDEHMGGVIGHTDVELDPRETTARFREGLLTGFVCDVIVHELRLLKFQADFALLGGAAFSGKSVIPAGEIKIGHIFSCFPNDTQIMCLRMNGATVIRLLNVMIREMPEEAPSFPHCSSEIKFVINMLKSPPQVEDVRVRGEPIGLDTKYVVGLETFAGTGKAKYKFIPANSTTLIAEENAAQLVVWLIEYFVKKKGQSKVGAAVGSPEGAAGAASAAGASLGGSNQADASAGGAESASGQGSPGTKRKGAKDKRANGAHKSLMDLLWDDDDGASSDEDKADGARWITDPAYFNMRGFNYYDALSALRPAALKRMFLASHLLSDLPWEDTTPVRTRVLVAAPTAGGGSSVDRDNSTNLFGFAQAPKHRNSSCADTMAPVAAPNFMSTPSGSTEIVPPCVPAGADAKSPRPHQRSLHAQPVRPPNHNHALFSQSVGAISAAMMPMMGPRGSAFGLQEAVEGRLERIVRTLMPAMFIRAYVLDAEAGVLRRLPCAPGGPVTIPMDAASAAAVCAKHVVALNIRNIRKAKEKRIFSPEYDEMDMVAAGDNSFPTTFDTSMHNRAHGAGADPTAGLGFGRSVRQPAFNDGRGSSMSALPAALQRSSQAGGGLLSTQMSRSLFGASVLPPSAPPNSASFGAIPREQVMTMLSVPILYKRRVLGVVQAINKVGITKNYRSMFSAVQLPSAGGEERGSMAEHDSPRHQMHDPLSTPPTMQLMPGRASPTPEASQRAVDDDMVTMASLLPDLIVGPGSISPVRSPSKSPLLGPGMDALTPTASGATQPNAPSHLTAPKFSDADREILMLMARALGTQLNFSKAQAKLQRTESVKAELMDMARMLGTASRDDDVKAIILKITGIACNVFNCDRASLFLLEKGMMWTVVKSKDRTENVLIRFPVGKGIAGECARTAKMMNIHDAYQCPLFNQTIDKQTGYTTRTILAVPMLAENKVDLLGVLQLINKNDQSVFTREEEETAVDFVSLAAMAIHNSFEIETLRVEGGDSTLQVLPVHELDRIRIKGGWHTVRARLDYIISHEFKQKMKAARDEERRRLRMMRQQANTGGGRRPTNDAEEESLTDVSVAGAPTSPRTRRSSTSNSRRSHTQSAAGMDFVFGEDDMPPEDELLSYDDVSWDAEEDETPAEAAARVAAERRQKELAMRSCVAPPTTNANFLDAKDILAPLLTVSDGPQDPKPLTSLHNAPGLPENAPATGVETAFAAFLDSSRSHASKLSSDSDVPQLLMTMPTVNDFALLAAEAEADSDGMSGQPSAYPRADDEADDEAARARRHESHRRQQHYTARLQAIDAETSRLQRWVEAQAAAPDQPILRDGTGLLLVTLKLAEIATSMLECDRATAYFVNGDHIFGLGKTSGDAVPLRLPIGLGVAGRCAKHGKVLNIPDAYKCDFFNQTIDKQTGYLTRTILAVPLLTPDNTRLIGLLQLINRDDDNPFDGEDEIAARTLLSSAVSRLRRFFPFEVFPINPNAAI